MAGSELAGGSNGPALAELPLLNVLAPDVRELVVASFVPVRYEFGETVFAAGDPADGFYVLASGIARVFVVGDDGQEVSLNLLRDGDSFGEGGLLENSARTATVRAASDLECAAARRLDLPALVGCTPPWPTPSHYRRERVALADFLRVHSAFSLPPAGAIVSMLQALVVVESEAGELVVREGDPAGPLYIVEEGRLRAFQRSARAATTSATCAAGTSSASCRCT